MIIQLIIGGDISEESVPVLVSKLSDNGIDAYTYNGNKEVLEIDCSIDDIEEVYEIIK